MISATTPKAMSHEGITAANLFLDHGTIAYLRRPEVSATRTSPPIRRRRSPTLPLVVMVNKAPAGAAEFWPERFWRTIALDIVGDKTFGVGSIQKVIDVPDGSALILSVAKYYTPNGKAIQDTAITPNIVVADNARRLCSSRRGRKQSGRT